MFSLIYARLLGLDYTEIISRRAIVSREEICIHIEERISVTSCLITE